MTRGEVIPILSLVKANYSTQFRGMSKSEANAMIDLWVMSFATEKAEDVKSAVLQYINSGREFAPKVGDIKAILGHKGKDHTWMRQYIKGSEYAKEWDRRMGR